VFSSTWGLPQTEVGAEFGAGAPSRVAATVVVEVNASA